MPSRVVKFAVTASLVLQSASMIAAADNTQSKMRRRSDIVETLAQPPVPSDPLELVTSGAQTVQGAEQRAAAIHLVNKAHALSNVRATPYDLKTTFVIPGSGGIWSLEDASPEADVYRWSAQGPGFTTVNLRSKALVYSSQPSGTIPLRLAQARTAIFRMYPQIGPYASLRTAMTSFNDTEVECVLSTPMGQGHPISSGRGWEESESCVDPKTGLLMTYSPAPGLFVAYDYTNAPHFHDKILPAAFTITESGQAVVQAHIESVAEPAKSDSVLFQPTSLQQIGVGPLMSTPALVRSRSITGTVNPSSTLQVVILDGLVDPQGHLSDVHVLASSDSGKNQEALDKAAEWKGWQPEDEPQGAAPRSHEVFFTLEFVNGQ